MRKSKSEPFTSIEDQLLQEEVAKHPAITKSGKGTRKEKAQAWFAVAKQVTL